MKKNSLILPEGYKSIIIGFLISIVLILFLSDCFGYLALLITLSLVYIYRNNNRHIFRNTQMVLAPIDSTVTAIDKSNGKYKIYCKVNLCNNHILRAPMDAELKVKKYKRGLNLNPNNYKASLYNEQTVFKIEDIKIKLISGLCNHKMKKLKETNVVQGDKISVFLDGLVIVTVPKEYDLMINIGDKLVSGQTVLFKK